MSCDAGRALGLCRMVVGGTGDGTPAEGGSMVVDDAVGALGISVVGAGQGRPVEGRRVVRLAGL